MDLKKRIKNPVFWVSFIMAGLTVAKSLGYEVVDIDEPVVEKVVYGVFGIMSVLGVAVDPTTSGITDK